MSALFCHDHRFVVAPDGRVYSSGQYDWQTVQRYEAVFGPLTIAGRYRALRDDDDLGDLSLVLASRDRFVGIADLSSLAGQAIGRRRAARQLEPAIEQADVVISRLPSEIGLIANVLAGKRRRPVLIQAVACVYDGLRSHSSLKARAYAPIAYRRMRKAVADAGFVQYVTQSFLQQRYPTRGASTGISNVELPAPDSAVLASRLAGIEATPSARVFGMIAALFHKEKGVDVAMRALAIAREDDPALKLKILGPGDPEPWAALARQLGIAEAVEFCGALPKGNAVLSWIDAIDVYVQASFQEGLPRALIEAMSRATPAIASGAGGTGELLSSEWLHRPGDHRTLARHMLASRPVEVRRQMAVENSTRSSEYSADVLDARRRAFWGQVAERRR